MKLHQFIQLNEKDKIQVLNTATKLAKRQENQHMYELFELNGYYIEARSSLLYDSINTIKAFDDHSMLDPYLIHLNLSDFQE